MPTENEPVKTNTVALLSKEHDITEFASADPTRYVINSVHYNASEKCLEATNGRQFIRVPVELSEEFVAISGQSAPPQDVILPLAPFKKALSNVPAKINVPVLQNVALVSNGKENTARLVTNDLDTENSLVVKAVEGQYPDINQAIPTKPATLRIGLNAPELRKIVNYAVKHVKETPEQVIAFEFIASDEAVRWSIFTNGERKVAGVLMPCRMA